MKSKAMKIAVISLAIITLLSGVLGVSATSYVVNVLSEDFSSAAEFIAAGDLNADKTLNATDVVSLRKLLIEDETDGTYVAIYAANADAKYSDVNGDDSVNVLDLVRQKKNIAADFDVVDTANGALVLKGNTAYVGDLFSAMGTGADYKVTFSYKSDSPVKVKINSMGEEIVIDKAAADSWTTVEETVTAPLTFAENGIELQIIGEGLVNDFSITRTNMDNELSENW